MIALTDLQRELLGYDWWKTKIVLGLLGVILLIRFLCWFIGPMVKRKEPQRPRVCHKVREDLGICHAQMDGDCDWEICPQIRDGEPWKTGRHCPLDRARV